MPLTHPNIAAAQVPDAGQVLRELRDTDRALETPKPAAPVLESLPQPAIKLPPGLQIPVTALRITGNSSIPTEELAALVRPWEGKTLDVTALNEAAGAITRRYQADGHLLAYAYLPVQKIEGGVVQIAVLEGRVDAVQTVAAQDVRLKDEVIQAHVGTIVAASQVKQADLERRLLLLNDMPGVVARSAFTPGGRPGTADLVVSVAEEEPLVNRIDFNNHGSPSTGRYRLGTRFQLRDIFGLGDSTQFRLQASDKGRLIDGGLSTRIPIGGEGWAVDAGISRLTYELGQDFATLGARGEANVISLGASYPVIRSLSRNLYAQGAYEHKRLTDFLTLLGSETRKRSHAVTGSLSLDNRDGWLGGGHSHAFVSLMIGDLDQGSGAATSLAKDGLYHKVSYDLFRQQTLTGPWSLLGRVQGQHAWENLDSSEKLGLTGAQGVRAYSPGEASVDRGSVLTLELRHATPLTGGTFTWSLFHDFAWGDINVAAAPGSSGNRLTLNGSGVGIGWSTGGDLQLSLTAAWRGGDEPTVDGERLPRFFFLVRKGF